MKGREYYTIFLTDFRYSNFDVDRLTYRQKGTTFYVTPSICHPMNFVQSVNQVIPIDLDID